MCWFSTEYAKQIKEAKTEQRLGIKQMTWHSKPTLLESRRLNSNRLVGFPDNPSRIIEAVNRVHAS